MLAGYEGAFRGLHGCLGLLEGYKRAIWVAIGVFKVVRGL